jgi:hypothetical protein
LSAHGLTRDNDRHLIVECGGCVVHADNCSTAKACL